MKKKKNLARRKFLKVMAAGTCGSAAHGLLAPSRGFLAFGETPPQAGVLGSNPTLIHVYLDGGCSLNIAGYDEGLYRDRMGELFKGPENGGLRLGASSQYLHPSLGSLHQEFDEGNLLVMNNASIPGKDRSHSNARDYIHSGALVGTAASSGWGAKLACQAGTTYSALSFSGSPLFLGGECNPSFALSSLDTAAPQFFSGSTAKKHELLRASLQATAGVPRNSTEASVYQTDLGAREAFEQLKAQINNELPPGINFPNHSFGRECRDALRILNAPVLQTRVMYLRQGGYDTHANEESSLATRLQRLDEGLGSLIAGIKAIGRADEVVICIMTEFGRTYRNNGGGTDHGDACQHFIWGGKVKGGLGTPAPDAQYLARNPGWFRDSYVDFREYVSQIVGDGMGYDSARVFEQNYNRVGVKVF